MKLIKTNPKDASAIIIYFQNKVLLQMRDNKSYIFYPNHWGLFGGAREKNENFKSTILREIYEEININLNKNRTKYFCKLDLEFPFKTKSQFVKRYFYTYEIEDINFFKKKIILREGKNKLFVSRKKYSELKITPYDKFALDLFFSIHN